MDMLPSKYVKENYFWPKSAKKSFCVWRVFKKLKKIKINFEKNLKFFFHKINSHYHIWIVPTSGVPQITLEGSRDQNPPVQSRVKHYLLVYLSTLKTTANTKIKIGFWPKSNFPFQNSETLNNLRPCLNSLSLSLTPKQLSWVLSTKQLSNKLYLIAFSHIEILTF